MTMSQDCHAEESGFNLFFLQQADDKWLILHRVKTDPDTFLETSSLGIRFPLRPRFLRRGRVVVKCAARLHDLYEAVSEIVLSVDLPQRASRMEERAQQSYALSKS